jgi:lysophospholipase L1-like esterase
MIDNVVVFMGDSLTEYMPPIQPRVCKLVIAGYSGMGVGFLRRAAARILRQHNPRIVWVCIGINDMWDINSELSLQEWESEFADLCAQIINHGAQLYGSTLMPVEKTGFGTAISLNWILKTNQAIIRQVDRHNGVVVDSYRRFAQPDGYLPQGASEDGVHLTLATYRQWIPFICQSLGIELK